MGLLDLLLQNQSTWIQCQNNRVRNHLKSPMGFPWRYTIGKEDIWRKWNILPTTSKGRPYISIGNSLRLTHPPSNVLKTRFQVRKESTIL